MAQRRNTRPQIYHKYGQVCLQAFGGWEFAQNIILQELTNSLSAQLTASKKPQFTLTCLSQGSSLIEYCTVYHCLRFNYSQGLKLEPL